jgi:RNA recognition motif-containing protein
LAQVFSRAGEIQHVSIPKFKGRSEEGGAREYENKGFAFVEFASAEMAANAVTLFNNCVPEELTNRDCANYIPVTGRLT